jgi:hypothetical protein
MAPTLSDVIATAARRSLAGGRSCCTRRCARTGCHDGEVERLPQQAHVLDPLLVEPGSMVPG